jgi:hypothetical protein
MANITVLSRLVNGWPRNVDLTTNTIVVSDITIGGGSGTNLTKTILDRLVSLQNGSDVGATYHTHNGTYFTKTEIGSSTGITGSDRVGDDNTYLNFTPTVAGTVKGALEGIDNALATAGGGLVKVTATDTTSNYLDASITAGNGLSKSITNPGANEVLDLAVNVDNSSIEINADTLRVKASGITSAMLAGSVDAAKIATGVVSNAEFITLDGITTGVSIQSQIDDKVSKSANSTMGSNISVTFSGGEVKGLPTTPTVADAAASKAYVDAVALGLSPKKSVRAATTAAGTLATSFANGQVIDGITLATGDRILIKDQASASQNGIYTVNASGAPTRAADFDSITAIDEINGAWVAVRSGTTNANRIYIQYGTVSSLGTDPINFDFYNPIASLIGGDMVTVSGSTITVDLATTSGLESSIPADANGKLRVKLEATNPSLQITGSNELAAKLNASGAITSGASGLTVGTDNSTVEISSNALRVKDAGITAAKLAASVAGAGLTGGAGTALAVANTDNSITVNADDILVKRDSAGAISVSASGIAVATDNTTIEKAANALQIKDLGVSTTKLAATSVTAAKLGSDVAGTGLAGGNGSALTTAFAPSIQAVGEIAGEAYATSTLFAVRYAQNAETSGRLYKADNDATSTDNFNVIGLVLTSGALSASNTMPNIVKFGNMTVTGHGLTIGKPVYLGASGALTSTSPSNSNLASVKVGIVKDANTIDVSIQIIGVN